MAEIEFYRGGTDLTPKPGEVIIDPSSGLVSPVQGISVWNRPNRLQKFGGAYKITNLPSELKIVQIGRNKSHFEIVPVQPMSYDEYVAALGRIVLVPAPTP